MQSPETIKLARATELSRRERTLLWSTYAWLIFQNAALVAFLKFLEHKDKAWFEVSSSMMAAVVYRISLFFCGLG